MPPLKEPSSVSLRKLRPGSEAGTQESRARATPVDENLETKVQKILKKNEDTDDLIEKTHKSDLRRMKKHFAREL